MELRIALIALAALALGACYGSAPVEGNLDVDSAADAVDDGVGDHTEVSDGPADPRGDDASDAPSDGVVVCEEPTFPEPPQIRFYVDDGTRESADIDMPCVVEDVIEEADDSVITLRCGTGAAMVTHRVMVPPCQRA